MKVAVCCTKANWESLAIPFAKGIEECGDEAVLIGDVPQGALSHKIYEIGEKQFIKEIENKISECDVSFQVCEGHEKKKIDYFVFRNAIKKITND